MTKNFKQLLKQITTFVFDYDGVLTNGIVILREEGEALRTANVKDGYAIQLATKNGYNVAVISGGRAQSLKKRFEPLNVYDVFVGVENKLKVFKRYIEEKNISPEHVLYMGDDIPDIEIMKIVGVPACPKDASNEIIDVSKYVSIYKGGEGCVRDIIEQVLKVQGKWMNHTAFHW